jgi:Holliday junction DNA helicase RuvA
MIAYLTGKILDHTIDRIIIDVQGVGYEVYVPVGTQGRLEEKEDGTVSVHIFTSVREDAIQLYGFGTRDEKKIFERVTSVSGVGPKLGLAILSSLEPKELFVAVETNDIASLTKVSGIGKKTAQRLILELKSKFDGFALDAISPSDGAGGALIEDLRSALANLGYGNNTIDEVAGQLAGRADDFDTIDDMLREAFKLLR